ncbi:hypothetical protein [Methylobacterium persicinum]|uniref:Uncharacterized protein n=1 Tax=Methylobacterium persicinum TaxID=374426 RepID=A0ABU0HI09_9HYPH|nr:hypothetical protein [Methylobacterium persicinum]MDQ0441967.1 hypothetical protein [Methylobacterium persicinum]GJE38932.1 hypothetical protein KHHGKMAE_3009 [Methylobacterium persicinum]
MTAVVFAITRASASNDADIRQRKAEAETLHSALRADRKARDERTARLRAMLMAVGEEPGC